ncbi:MlaD family protein [Geothrix sp. PMB-07]|uniref:MlaD family protein n=1 Tax=Geothrix sp. PMB-07 TaxID=3068640 RepID=UPI002742113D|nr:MlaD family protein [Geothrix sp. PMB-07]WLT30332.1 MlaD family protein [Geothrix sp. PMB-07]
MKFEKQDARLGLLVLAALGLFLGLLAYKNAGAVTERSYPLVVRLDQMEGLAAGADVQLKGYRVGSVERVDLRQEGKDYHFLARIAVKEDIKLWRGTRASLAPKGVGSVMLDLRLPDLAERTVPLAAGDEIPGDSGTSIAGVLDRADHLMASLQAGVDALRTRIEKKGLGDVLEHPAVRQTLHSLDGTLREFQALAKDSRGLVGHADHSMAEADKALADLDKSLAGVRTLLEKRGPELDQILVSLAASLKQADAFMGRFATEDQPELEQSLKSLRRSLASVEELLELLKQKPNRVVWGTPSETERERARKALEAKQAPPKP